ncbi:MAG: class I SAM-dependent DNA methyltransferase [Deinococcales bacterium]
METPFSSLAFVYDAIFADVEYDHWCEFTLSTLTALGWQIPNTNILDLACGTGNSLAPYVQRGFSVVGADKSKDMLEVARQKFPNLEFVQQGFLELDLPERFGLVLCVFDSLNNLLDITELEACFKRIKTQLLPNGAFVFDCNTPLGVTDLWDDNEFVGDVALKNGAAHFHWTHQAVGTNLGEVSAHIWLMDYTGALQREFTEVHLERGYTREEVRAALSGAGFLEIVLLEYPDGAPIQEDTPRFWGFAR